MLAKLKTINKATLGAVTAAVVSILAFYLGWPPDVMAAAVAGATGLATWAIPNAG